MPIKNFGSLLNFAEAMEKQDMEFYLSAASNPEISDLSDLFQGFARDGEKNITNIQRTRRENVTEMILEGITDFFRKPFVLDAGDHKNMDRAQVLAFAEKMETRALSYYMEGAAKIKALPEVAMALKQAGKKRTAHMKKLSSL